ALKAPAVASKVLPVASPFTTEFSRWPTMSSAVRDWPPPKPTYHCGACCAAAGIAMNAAVAAMMALLRCMLPPKVFCSWFVFDRRTRSGAREAIVHRFPLGGRRWRLDEDALGSRVVELA